ncbi:MAG: glutamine--fructose-6-phosphate transaminase (isomerizing) [Clostridia bacterium]|nr:glutamine--fructose-6-phosphate transaminase (isomerizing) [Clostridia bacterium]MCL6522115.1 glutamine--fructose-6-phosphate transaminase (isomerizing) [Bacillota bacterium]
MCGIVGYVGGRRADQVLLDGLRRLEYRGYDSAGIAVNPDHHVEVRKVAGRLEELVRLVEEEPLRPATVGIGHTRWATHGRPTRENAHPHTDEGGHWLVVHNGILENFASLRRELEARGHRFRTETDSEVVPHLLEELYRGDLLEAVRQTALRLRGSFALVVLHDAEPERLVAVRQESPLVIGLGREENLVASDLQALLPYTREALVLENGEIAEVDRRSVRLLRFDGSPVERRPMHVTWSVEESERGGYRHFMLKEIMEQPEALQETLRGRIDAEAGELDWEGLGLDRERLARVRRVAVVACGTAFHAGLTARELIERWARIPVEAEVASEFRYRRPLVDAETLALAISQSGETSDTLAGLRLAREMGATVLGVCNVMGSSVDRESDLRLYTRAGPEIAVASTKAYTTQLLAVTLLALALGESHGRLPAEERHRLVRGLAALPARAREALALSARLEELAREAAGWSDVFYLGRGLDVAVAMEGALKLKEISYLHAEAYPAGELKHGTLALISEGVPVFAVLTQPELRAKTLSNLREVRARGGRLFVLAPASLREEVEPLGELLPLPETEPELMPVLAAVPLQLFAYHAAVARGNDVDKPRNLAKSVTVE